jgi:zinc/manganese transport system substrate-binding protein
MRMIFVGLILLAVSLASGATATERMKVVASFSILRDMVRQVTGDAAEVTTIVGPDADAHVYQPNTRDARAVASADVIFVNGLGFETWSSALIETSGSDAVVLVATAGIEPLEVDGAVDPHAWNALTNGMIYVQNIAEGMVKVDPANARTYRNNAEAYAKRLGTVHENAVIQFASLPDDRRTVVTAHDAFGYLASAYDLNFLAPVGIDTEAEPSAKDLARLIDHLKETGAGALFVENISSPALVEQISRETGLKIGGRLFSDALSEKGGPATSYIAMFEHNLAALMAALSGPE